MGRNRPEKPEKPQIPQSLTQTVQELERTGDLAVERAKINVAESIYGAMRLGEVSKAELSRRLQKSRAYVTQLLRGDANFTLDTLVRVSAVLDSRLEVRLVPNCGSVRWNHLNRNSGIQIVHSNLEVRRENVRSDDVAQALESTEALFAEAA